MWGIVRRGKRQETPTKNDRGRQFRPKPDRFAKGHFFWKLWDQFSTIFGPKMVHLADHFLSKIWPKFVQNLAKIRPKFGQNSSPISSQCCHQKVQNVVGKSSGVAIRFVPNFSYNREFPPNNIVTKEVQSSSRKKSKVRHKKVQNLSQKSPKCVQKLARKWGPKMGQKWSQNGSAGTQRTSPGSEQAQFDGLLHFFNKFYHSEQFLGKSFFALAPPHYPSHFFLTFCRTNSDETNFCTFGRLFLCVCVCSVFFMAKRRAGHVEFMVFCIECSFFNRKTSSGIISKNYEKIPFSPFSERSERGDKSC